ncbi:NF-X1-type zinc finger protein NFXL1 [Exaiptasia diaphana]|nr:NF-X1-type zinc finger protein NFXL1 [Exaiptasia diaphana]
MASVSKRGLYLGQGRGRGRVVPHHKQQIGRNVKDEKCEVTIIGKPSQERLNKVHMIKESAKKFVDEKYEDDSSEDEEIEDDNIISTTLKTTTQYLVDSCRPGANVCLICIATIKRLDAIWHCGQCFSIFHISCIQKWAIDGAVHTSPLSQENFPALEARWFCPKCRHEFKQSECPTKYYCYCGKEQDPKFDPWIVPHSCGQTCGRELKPSCGHECLLLCHPELSLPCTEDVPTCGDTCNKKLECGRHNCTQRCHVGPCGACRQFINKRCRCGKYEKHVQCCNEYLCESKCTNMRQCHRHQCKRKCCDNKCPPCEQICGRSLNCKNHKCNSPCHEGLCYPCPLTVNVSCFCGKTVVTLPCGRERTTKPPKCHELCSCPPCRQTCGNAYKTCEHSCLLPCHDNIPEKASTKISQGQKLTWGPVNRKPEPESVVCMPCPPCQSPVQRKCFGEHELQKLQHTNLKLKPIKILGEMVIKISFEMGRTNHAQNT